jgi:hypothetical protein
MDIEYSIIWHLSIYLSKSAFIFIGTLFIPPFSYFKLNMNQSSAANQHKAILDSLNDDSKKIW